MAAEQGHALDELSAGECFRLLATHSIGRIAVVTEDDEAPLVAPVNYVLDNGAVVFRTAAGTKDTEVRRHRVSFQIDEIDPFHRTGWSVLVRGYAREATDWEVAHVAVEPWAPGVRGRWIRLEPDTVTGRRIVRPGLAPDLRGYL